MSFLEVLDRAAGATKSGGTTRRAAKMVCLDMDHPEILDFVQWKVREERKAQALIGAGYDSDFNGDAYHTVSGQNSNNSVRVTDEFMRAALAGGTWQTRARTTGEVVDTLDAREAWNTIAEAAWGCADPGVQYDSTINRWHTCPNTDRINASNPCSEYMFLDSYYRGAHGIMIVYDVADQTSFQNIRQWLQEIERYAGDNVGRIIVGNKCDLEGERAVSREEGAHLARQFGCKFIETSAKSRINVDNAFYDLVREIRRYNKEMSGYSGGGPALGSHPGQKLEMDNQAESAGCCSRCVVM
jgi:hypothetical protein